MNGISGTSAALPTGATGQPPPPAGAGEATLPGAMPTAATPATAAAADGGSSVAENSPEYQAAFAYTLREIYRAVTLTIQAVQAKEAAAQGAAGGGSRLVGGASALGSTGASALNASSRTSAIPSLSVGANDTLTLANGQVSYRQIEVPGGTSFTAPAATNGAKVELFAVRDYQKGGHSTQVLEPLSGSVTVPQGASMKVIARIVADQPGSWSIPAGVANFTVNVSTRAASPLPMMAWVNESNSTKRGASAAAVSGVLSHFGVAATGASGTTVVSGSRPAVTFFSAAYEAATKASPSETAARIIKAERDAAAKNPGATFWVQISDEQDTNAAMVSGTVSWIRELRTHLNAAGSNAKLFVAAQAKAENIEYANVVDGWATTQSSAGRSRSESISAIQNAGAQQGRRIELLEYPGNAFFDAGTAGSAAISTASAALDGASSWFIYSANNLDMLEAGQGIEGKGDIGGLVVIDGGTVLPTLALIEAEYGASLGAAARTVGATGGQGGSMISTYSASLDGYKHRGGIPDLYALEQDIARQL